MRPTITILVLLISLACKGYSQTASWIVEGEGRPPHDLQADWFIDTVGHDAYKIRGPGAYNIFTSVTAYKNCGHWVALLRKPGWEKDGWELWTRGGNTEDQWKNCNCWGVLIRLSDQYKSAFYLDKRRLGWSWSNEPQTTDSTLTQPDTVAGNPVFCISKSPKSTEGYDKQAIHGFGMINSKGEWVIPAIFDAPFSFQDGFAEVLYYGVKRKINEKGEFVE